MYITVSFFGQGFRSWTCDLSEETFLLLEDFAARRDCSIEALLYDLDFLKRLGYTGWHELATQSEERYFQIDSLNRIEVRGDKKILIKMRSEELLPDNMLFPLFETKLLTTPTIQPQKGHKRIILYQHETGLFFKFRFQTDSFRIEDLIFVLSPALPYYDRPSVYRLNYRGNHLLSKQEDTLTRSSRVFVP